MSIHASLRSLFQATLTAFSQATLAGVVTATDCSRKVGPRPCFHLRIANTCRFNPALTANLGLLSLLCAYSRARSSHQWSGNTTCPPASRYKIIASLLHQAVPDKRSSAYTHQLDTAPRVTLTRDRATRSAANVGGQRPKPRLNLTTSPPIAAPARSPPPAPGRSHAAGRPGN